MAKAGVAFTPPSRRDVVMTSTFDSSHGAYSIINRRQSLSWHMTFDVDVGMKFTGPSSITLTLTLSLTLTIALTLYQGRVRL